jgi:hypothetical protein
MKILFLDMDGVVNSARYFEVLSKRQYRKARGKAKAEGRTRKTFVDMIDPKTIPHLNAIVERSGAKVVLSSSWRVPWTYQEVNAMLRERGFTGEIIASTPTRIAAPRPTEDDPHGFQRGYEIQAWLDAWTGARIEATVILDDSDDMAHLLPYLVQTTWGEGLQAEHVDRALVLLGAFS